MTHSDDDFQIDGFDFVNQVVQFGLGFRFDDVLIEVEESIGSISHFRGH
jgi:hypothetical protein